MNQNQHSPLTKPSADVVAMAEFELSNWQKRLIELEANPDSPMLDVLLVKRQIARLTNDLNYQAGIYNSSVHLPVSGNDSAFVVPEEQSGLTKREWFAGQALLGILSGSLIPNESPRAFAMDSVNLADALIEELNKK
jgi:hypothetical protein